METLGSKDRKEKGSEMCFTPACTSTRHLGPSVLSLNADYVEKKMSCPDSVGFSYSLPFKASLQGISLMPFAYS